MGASDMINDEQSQLDSLAVALAKAERIRGKQ
jgi:hypothetical protein